MATAWAQAVAMIMIMVMVMMMVVELFLSKLLCSADVFDIVLVF